MGTKSFAAFREEVPGQVSVGREGGLEGLVSNVALVLLCDLKSIQATIFVLSHAYIQNTLYDLALWLFFLG